MTRIQYYILICFVAVVFFSDTKQSHAITISPLRHAIVLEKGEERTVSLAVYNETAEVVTVVPEVDAFSIHPKTGVAQFGAPDKAKTWISAAQKNQTIVPGDQKQLDFLIRVPKDAKAESHHIGLFATQPSTLGAVTIGSRTGSLLSLHIAGEVEESIALRDFSVEKKLVTTPKTTLFLHLNNAGTIHLVPTGGIRLINRKGEILEDISINPEESSVLNGEQFVRNYATSQLSVKDVGKIRVQLYMKYGITHREMSHEIAFWYIPKILFYGGIFFGISILIGMVSVWYKKLLYAND
ncbi:MAG: hypothetical protein CL685_00640 [Candidatus Magasanikbacteria bacterium]|nr:hypothetical protein [Candidatus Magasanikbacteria bacterium]|tara:strand:- start:426 stop:1313 length:888 start_codon:yes stop_codon:yes gene_type:complete